MDAEESTSRGTTTEALEGLFNLIRAGDEKAISRFFEIASERIGLVARRILRGGSNRPHGHTDEVISRTSLTLFEELRGGLGSKCEDLRHLMNYLAKVIRNKAIDLARESGGPKRRTQFPSRPLPPDPVGAVDNRVIFYEMIEGLPDREREVVDLRIMWSCTFQEIGKLLAISPTTAKGDYAKGLRRLKQQFDARDLGEDVMPSDETGHDFRFEG